MARLQGTPHGPGNEHPWDWWDYPEIVCVTTQTAFYKTTLKFYGERKKEREPEQKEEEEAAVAASAPPSVSVLSSTE